MIHGSTLAWAFFANLNGVLGNYATLGLNIADFSRYANKPSAQNVQALVIPVIFTIVGLLGIFTAAASQTAYPNVQPPGPIWNPIVIIELWMEGGSHGGRAAAAFAAIGLIIVTLGINISANSISAANDLMSFCPKYINIRRGQILAAVIGSWAFVPVSLFYSVRRLIMMLIRIQWKILESATKFLAFLGGYTIFLGPMTSILITELVTLSVHDLFTN
jgi:NCS1 family nucleobase:cation symporter-1